MGNDPLRVGMIGAGAITDYHIAGLQAAGAEVVDLFSRSEGRAKEKAERYRIPHFTTNYEEILGRRDVDAAVIATPDFTHEEMALKAAAAGKAILLQKPMACSSQECSNIIRAAEQTGVLLVVSFMHRYFEEVEKVREFLATGALGEVYTIRQRNATPGAHWAAWFYTRARGGGGVVQQLGVHGIDLLRYLFGEIEAVKATLALTEKKRVLADGSVIVPDAEDTALATYRFASGALATHEMSYNELAGTDRFRMEIYGSRGTAWLRTERGRLAVVAPATLGREGWVQIDLAEPRFGWHQHRHFIAMARGEAPPDTSARDGLATLLVSEAIYRADHSSAWEEIQWPQKSRCASAS